MKPEFIRILCEGPICHPTTFQCHDIAVEEAFVNICVAELKNDIWVIPEGWKLINKKIYCPRCVKYSERK